MTEEMQNKELAQLLLAVKALAKSVEKSLLTGAYAGTGDLVARSYTTLHGKIAQLMPDDFFITDVLKLDVNPEDTDQAKMQQVSLLCSQMIDYLDNLTHPQRVRANFQGEVEDLRSLGRELQEQILSMTKQTLRRAIANIDINIRESTEGGEKAKRHAPEPPPPPSPPTPSDPAPWSHRERDEEDR